LEVDGIERHNKILIVIDLLEGTDNSRLTSNAPDKVLMRECVV
jgi:hypothetical protein